MPILCLEHGYGVLDCVIHDMLDLKLVLVVCVPLCQVPELLGQMEAMRNVFWGNKILGHFDAVVQVSDLMSRARRDEHGVAHALNDGIT